MAIGHQLVQKQTQRLIMTHDLRQSIELLPLSTLELSDKIQAELIENPLLEEVAGTEKAKTPELYSIGETRKIEKDNHLKSQDISWQDSYTIDGPRYLNSEASDKNQKMIEASPIRETLSEHLLWQLKLLDLSDDEVYIGEIMISMINEKGFITTSPEELCKEMNLNLRKAKKVLDQIQLLDPIGIGAKDIQETLLIQSKVLRPDDHNLYNLIENHFLDLERLDYKKISKSMKLSEENVEDLAKIIKKLEPYPATLYASKKTDYIVPDVIIANTDGEFSVQINDEWLPKLTVNTKYKEAMLGKASPEEKEYISTKMNSAQWLIKSINQRRQTLYRVVSTIIDFQIEFFRNGINFVRPLTLKDVAEKLSMHESTISRITTSKYVQTSWGVFELKWFFSSGVKSTEGGKESSKKIHDIIKNLVKDEPEDNPLSDQDIVEIMNKKGIEIARRTVAKYRKVLKILPSSRRKKINTLKAS
ncbi:MAG: RNA polymerase factor sigma-54 [Leptospira sp.]|nr:RNA polymerase factor sigma-54 [Leptospira sp.]